MTASLVNELYNQNGINSLQNIFDKIYPVGTIYISTGATSPALLFGGQWEQIKDRFLLAAGSTHALSSTGGEETHTLTTSEMPSHTHIGSSASAGAHAHSRGTQDITGSHFFFTNEDYTPAVSGAFTRTTLSTNTDIGAGFQGDGDSNNYTFNFKASNSWTGASSSNGVHTHSITNANTGGGGSHNNMPPYLAVNVWKRIA